MSVRKKINVRMTVTFQIDPMRWALAYGTGDDESAIRKDARSYVETQINSSAAADEGAIIPDSVVVGLA